MLDQRPCVFVLRRSDDRPSRSLLPDDTILEHKHTIGNVGHESEIVRDEKKRQSQCRL